MAKADRTPKKIAGLKLPKSIREAPAIRSLLATPAGCKILGDALMAGAAAAAAQVMEAHEAAKTADIKKAEKLAPNVGGKMKRKGSRPAPGAAPADDVTPASEGLAPLSGKPRRLEQAGPDAVKPGAAD